MSTRLDLVLQKYPEHDDGIRLLASRDPSGNLKYLDWGAKMLAARQALAPEIADVLVLFHQFAGRRLESSARPRSHRLPANKQVHPDLYTYRPQDFAKLRDLLFKIKRSVDRKRRKRERLYHLEGTIEADVVYDAPDLIVRHIKNKQACVHYGLGTKWCIAMRREGYFEDYEAHNATFFFFERKVLMDDEFDKVALMVPRSGGSQDSHLDATLEAFTSVDRRVDMMSLAKVHGLRIFDIFREVYERSERYPGSTVFHVYAGTATPEQLESAFASTVKGGLSPHETDSLLESICCNDAAPQSLLEEILRRAPALSTAAWRRRRHRRWRARRAGTEELVRTVTAAMAIHPLTPSEVREGLVKWLRRHHVNIDAIRRVKDGGRVGVSYRDGRKVLLRSHRRRTYSVKALRARAEMFDRLAARTRKKARTLQRKLAEAKKKSRRKSGAQSSSSKRV